MPEHQKATSIAIIGAGFAGLGMGHHLKRAGFERFEILEKGGDVGGVWRENTYPGAACDVPSALYSFSFYKDFPFSHRCARQPEILAYLRACAQRFDLARHVSLDTEVLAARFDEATSQWTLDLGGGRTRTVDVLISAVGQLHHPRIPDLPGAADFQGAAWHSARWEHGYDLRGKRVAVIGTGASAVQLVPAIAEQVDKLYVFQRSPGWIVPLKGDEETAASRSALLRGSERAAYFVLTEALSYCYQGNAWAQRLLRASLELHLRYAIRDPVLRAKLTPDYPVGCNRILLSSRWLPTLTLPHVSLVTGPIRNVTARGVVGDDGILREVDAIIYATGFSSHAFLAPIQVTGLGGARLHDVWARAPQAFRGVSVHGFPNLAMLYGPNTNLGSGSIVYVLEAQQRYIVRLLEEHARRGASRFDVDRDAEERFNAWIQERSSRTSFSGGCQSWYKDDEGRNINNWPGRAGEYDAMMAAADLSAYSFSSAPPRSFGQTSEQRRAADASAGATGAG